MTHCIGFDVLDHIEETYDAPAIKPTDPHQKKIELIVKLWIYGTISQSLLQMVLKKDSSARQVWVSLEQLFHDNKDAKAFQLDNELRNISIGDLPVTNYCTRIKTMASLLDK